MERWQKFELLFRLIGKSRLSEKSELMISVLKDFRLDRPDEIVIHSAVMYEPELLEKIILAENASECSAMVTRLSEKINANKSNLFNLMADLRRGYWGSPQDDLINPVDSLHQKNLYEPSRITPSNPWSSEEDRQLRDEIGKGLSLKEIKYIHNRTRGEINQRIKDLNIGVTVVNPPGRDKRPGPLCRYPNRPTYNGHYIWSKKEDVDLAEEYSSGVPLKTISERHGRTEHAIMLRVLKLNLKRV